MKLAVRAQQHVELLRHLRRHVRGEAVLVWDGLNAHRSLTARAPIEKQRRWLDVVRLPAYAPELRGCEEIV